MTREETIRKIRHQAFRRSTLELELLLSRLTKTGALSQFTDDELKHLNTVLDLDDVELQQALLTRGPAPAGTSPALWAWLLFLIVPKPDHE
jgi:succinate dehydrogenase flavin-adding protein (antitoxin of CptAB toxin-antitoxin module)